MPKIDEYRGIRAAAGYLGVCQNTLRAWAAREEVPVTRNPANGYRLFQHLDLERLLQEIGKSFDKKPRKPR